ncbi:S-adenosyl-methyltransferase MraW [Nautilia profundicola AmH]|uniref:Ribosomal RNA small subunit methyltransferase H n=1 Tax=Nautilia profundicola (strain ATCC BAA-1463 / DSM 18972 / AmH) TaxID=598659 RepID=RSMH_NAUPA|nr:16S rRNA (cytosine(1402)-N(4))-methyltransferase RsmH [Nautilia profundicola]B9L9G3.1 RecName: Full=Ribosomal RNA small subunit methyltransferase H; AltName: Full=16S rRNA m(4)C1402 methyltransferase; AltName: Full=rRNA (cytosine-N(4)-)-methyltransferase RsmH [Nautilia profundicola AmH]ACM93172.1 S-adenosyl-methyltransferase MraW [Nautilia profundicola AmH]
MRIEDIPHIPVLLNETIGLYNDMPENGYFIDCTLGFGGHSEAILEKYPNIKLIGIDQDAEAMHFAKNRLARFGDRVQFINKRASSALEELPEDLPVSGILADIGVSSYQLDNKERGFTFESEELDMRMDKTQDFSAKDVVNFYSKEDLERIIKNYGECRRFKKVVSAIISKRPIKSNRELADILGHIGLRDKKDLAKIFQAIRIEVNNELNELEKILKNAKKLAKNGTILGIITFHSLEDRIVKNTFKEWSKKCICPPEAIRCECGGNNQLGKILTKKPLVASKEEIKMNPRSRSAKLRGFQFIRG